LIDQRLPEHSHARERRRRPLENERNLDRLSEVHPNVGSGRGAMSECARRDLIITEWNERGDEYAGVARPDRARKVRFGISDRNVG
jgi:hypothetical protein